MTEKDLSKYYKLKLEVDDLKERIEEFGDGVGSIKIKEDISSFSGVKSSIQDKIMELKERYIEKRLSALEEYIKIENYIANNIEDAEIRTIMRKRFLDLKSWDKIGEELHLERTTASKKMRKYLKVTTFPQFPSV